MIGPKSALKLGKSKTLASGLTALGLFIFAGYLLADLGTLYSRRFMLPTQPPPVKPPQAAGLTPLANYQNVVNRNIFSSDGLIPEPMIAKLGPGGGRKEQPPVLSQLPITLMGTLVHTDPARSLAAIEIKGKNTVTSYRAKMQVENLATVESVERMKVIIRNLNTGRLEFIEMKNTSKLSLKTSASGDGKGEVKKTGVNEFEMKRSDLLKYTSDLSSVLMQARVVPARRGGSGEVYGFRLVDMQPGSIYSQLGLQVMDVIMGVNGTPVTSAQQAMELYSTLKSADHVDIQTERGGQQVSLKYKISN